MISVKDGEWAGDVTVRFLAPGARPHDVLFAVSRLNSNGGPYSEEPNSVSQSGLPGEITQVTYDPADGSYELVKVMDK